MRSIKLQVLICCLFIAHTSIAQTQALKHVTSSIVGHIKGLELTGTWEYHGAAVSFKSDNLLKKAGGAVAANATEKELDKQLEKIGIKKGSSRYEFKSDSTFTHTIGSKKLKGKYSYNSETGYITLKYLKLVPVKAKLTGNTKKIEMLFESGEFLTLISFIGGHSGIAAVKAITSITNSYDGMMTGFELHKQ